MVPPGEGDEEGVEDGVGAPGVAPAAADGDGDEGEVGPPGVTPAAVDRDGDEGGVGPPDVAPAAFDVDGDEGGVAPPGVAPAAVGEDVDECARVDLPGLGVPESVIRGAGLPGDVVDDDGDTVGSPTPPKGDEDALAGPPESGPLESVSGGGG